MAKSPQPTPPNILDPEMVWCEPPPGEGRSKDRAVFFPVVGRTLRARPGQWMRLRIYRKFAAAHSLAHRLRNKFEADGYEFIVRETNPGFGVWGRLAPQEETE